MTPVLVLAAHGTRSAQGSATTQALAAAVRSTRPELDVRVSFVDVAEPDLRDVVAALTQSFVVVPVLLSGGYHVHVDIPRVLRGRADAAVTPALGPDRLLSLALADRLRAVTRVEGPALLVSTGSSDEAARQDVVIAAQDLAEVLGVSVRAVFMSGPQADLDDALSTGHDVVSYLLAEGVFHSRLARLATGRPVSEPIGVHPRLVELILRRYERAAVPLSDREPPLVQ